MQKIKTFIAIFVFFFALTTLVACDDQGGNYTNIPINDGTIRITTNNVNNYFRSHVEVYERGYGFRYELTVTPKTNVKNVDLYIEVSSSVNYTYTLINTNQPIYRGNQQVVMSTRLSSTGYGSASTYKGTGTNILSCNVYVEVIGVSGTIQL